MKLNFLLLFIMIIIIAGETFLVPGTNAQTKLIVRCDDIGMCHTVNMAAKKLIETGIPFSTSVMFTCPWYKEAVEILKENPQISIGIHLVLNSEWKYYKWGPVAGRSAVQSIVDSNGYFYQSEEDFAKCGYKLSEAETELRSQIERAIKSGLHIDYIDAHMTTAVSTPELKALVEKLAKEYHLGISRYFNENYNTLWADPPEKKFSRLMGIVNNLKKNEINLLVVHLGMETEEMNALIDMNNPDDPYRVSQHRQAELLALSSRGFEDAVSKNNIKLITYRDLISQVGLDSMKRPVNPEY
ncbi:MAG: ChbG/HpnK family deacetylase [Ignavibacteriaceae bacterium]